MLNMSLFRERSHFHLVKDRAISAFRDPENSDSNFSNFEVSEDFQQFKRNILQQLHYR